MNTINVVYTVFSYPSVTEYNANVENKTSLEWHQEKNILVRQKD